MGDERHCATCGQPAEPGRLYCGQHGPAEPTAEELRTIASGEKPFGATDGRGQAAMICPHCGTRGQVHRSGTRRKRGIHGGKATAGILTGGLSLLGTGLARKVPVTELACGNCGTTWHVD